VDKIAVLSISIALIGGIGWFFSGRKKSSNREDALPEEKIKKLELSISGMHCAGCVAGIEATLKATEGIVSASVNLTTSKGVFEYNPAVISKQEIIQKIKQLGYEASEDIEEFEKKS